MRGGIEVEVVSRTHLPGDVTEVVYREGDSLGLRLGRIVPASTSQRMLNALASFLARRRTEDVLVPDRFERLDGRRIRLSLPLTDPPAYPERVSLEVLAERLSTLHERGLCCLGVDRRALIRIEPRTVLIAWGCALLGSGQGLAPEVAAGGYPNPLADAYALGKLASASPNLIQHNLSEDDLARLASAIPSRRAPAAERLGLRPHPSHGKERFPAPGLSCLCGGGWRQRDSVVNEFAGTAASKGMRARVVRCSSREAHRPLPDSGPPMGPVLCPADLLRRIFGPASDMDRLLIVDDAHRASPDLAAILERLSILPPPGLRLVLSAPTLPEYISRTPVRTIDIPGNLGEADDLPLDELEEPGPECSPPGPSWYGPRLRCRADAVPGSDSAPPLRELFDEGADRLIAARAEALSPEDPESATAAASLIRLGRYEEALRLVEDRFAPLSGRALLGLGRAQEALPHLRGAFEEDPGASNRLLLARALAAGGMTAEAERLLLAGDSSAAAVKLADLLDAQGRPAEALVPLREAITRASGQDLASLLCAQARIYMRLGRYDESLESAGQAVSMAGALEEGDTLMVGALTRGRVREVVGDWDGALNDYRLAVALFEAVSHAEERPPHVDLYVLLLRTGAMEEARDVLRRLPATTPGGGGHRRMEQMLLAYRSVLLGAGEAGLPFARRATELAAAERNPLHQALSTLYAGALTVQTGRKREGVGLIRRARSRASLLGDQHLLLLCDLELLAAGAEGVRKGLRACASELGLVPEELRAAVLQDGDCDAIGGLLDLPAPLEALAAATACGRPIPPAVSNRLEEALHAILPDLPAAERNALEEMHSEIGSDGGDALQAVLQEAGSWARKRLVGSGDLQDLAESLGLRRLATSRSEECPNPVSEDPPLFASSPLPSLSSVGAILAALISATSESLESPGSARGSYPELVGDSRCMVELRQSLDRASGSDIPVLLQGETGTGKELAARAIHRERDTRGGFVPVDCGAIPGDLLESELFGARRGAYTGLREDRKGLIEEARGGTLFLDEIGNLPLALQAKLLRALETGRFRRLGENTERESAFGLVAATNTDLQIAVSRGVFRNDLYYRIAVLVVTLPPLREHLEDIPLLTRHFLDRTSTGGRVEVSSGALRALEAHSWPGNVRELRNVIARAVALSGGARIGRRHIRLGEVSPSSGDSHMESIRHATARHVLEVLKSCDGNRSRASGILECDPKTVRKYLRIAGNELGLDWKEG